MVEIILSSDEVKDIIYKYFERKYGCGGEVICYHCEEFKYILGDK